jgi:hypothetical protein
MRAILSIKPPGGNGTINLIGLAGQAWANALLLKPNNPNVAAVTIRSFRLVSVCVSVMVCALG